MDQSIMKKLFLTLALLLAPSLAWGQCNGSFAANTYCGSNAGGAPGPVSAASFPIAIALKGLCSTSGAVPIYNLTGATWQCSTIVGSYAHWGAGGITEPTDFWITRPNSAGGTILQMQDGKGGNLRTLSAGNTGLNLQSLVDTSASGWNYTGLSMDIECQAGTNGGCTGINIIAQANTNWTPGAGGLPGANGLEVTGIASKGGHVWGADFTGWCLTTACAENYGIEVNVRNDIAATAQSSGIWLVNENSVVPTAGSAVIVSGLASNVGFPTAGFYFSTVAGFYPLTTGATLLKSDAATIANGIDLSALTITTSAFKSTAYNVDGSGVVTGSAFKAGAAAGLSVTKTVRASGGAADCNLVFTGGLLTGGTC